MEDNSLSRQFQQDFLGALHQSERRRVENLLSNSTAQLLQDLFVMNAFNFKRHGFFVEVGAADGMDLSNTLLLERHGWKGILSEAARTWHDALASNRQTSLDFRAVWSKSGETLLFRETNPPILSQLADLDVKDMHSSARIEAETYTVSTVSLLDLLEQHDAPKEIDFLSLDTEGSELHILQAFDFDKYSFGVVCVDHNYTPAREGIRELMAKNGYARVEWVDTLFDDWYIRGN